METATTITTTVVVVIFHFNLNVALLVGFEPTTIRVETGNSIR